jgi:hypothetical protein
VRFITSSCCCAPDNPLIATVMRWLLTGHAVTFNRRHCRTGHLFYDCHKSTLRKEDAYLLELVG